MLRRSIRVTNNSKEKSKSTPSPVNKQNIRPASARKIEASSPAECSPIKRQRIESSEPAVDNQANAAIVSSPAKPIGEDTFKQDVLALLENEFTCCICEEIMVKVTVTKCKHFFCAYCLEECKKQKKTCPMCRSPRMLERGIDFIDNYLNKMTKLVSEDLYSRRLELIKEREGGPSRRTTRRSIERN